MSTPSPTRPLKILMLHGYTQSGPLFSLKTKALKKSLEKAFPPCPKPGHLPSHPAVISLHYPTGPMALDPRDIPGYESPTEDGADGSKGKVEAYAWWKRGSGEPKSGAYSYVGLDEGLDALAGVLKREGPFDGVMGFSQGAAAAGMLAALLETGRKEAFERNEAGMKFPESFLDERGETVHPPLRFAVCYSGFAASSHERYRGFVDPVVRTPVLHFLGSVDTVVEEARSLRFVECCDDGRGKEGGVERVVYHPGGHVLPSSQKYVGAVVGFIREVLGEGELGAKKGDDVRAEDMDVPF